MENLEFFVLSDSVGDTAEQTAKAAIAQFEGLNYKMKKFSHIRSKAILEDIFQEIERPEMTIVFHSLIETDLKEHLEDYLMINGINSVDILFDPINKISKMTSIKASNKVGALRKLDDNYFKRVEAIEFAVRYDDGKDPRGVLKADLTIIGVSRTSKTPLSMYIANKNYRVANIPLVPETKPPKEIFEVPNKKIVGLTNSPENLNMIRKERLKSLGLQGGSSYSDLERILEEIEYAHEIMRKIGCPIIDVSNKAIEETAEIILNYLKKSNSTII